MDSDGGSAPPRGCVLLVDDEPAIRDLLRLVLQHENLAVRTAKNGVEALDIVQKAPIDILLVDYKMPGMTGLELSIQVRRLHPCLPIALLSGHMSLLKEGEIAAAGVNFTFAKPFDVSTLCDWINAVLPCCS